MTLLSFDGAQDWARSEGYSLDESGLPDISADDAEDFEIPADAGRRVAVVREQLSAFSPGDHLLIWLSEWSVWPSGQWEHLFYRFRQSYGHDELLMDRPAHLVPPEERDAAVSIAVYSALMLWDCYVLGPGQKDWVFYSHDEWGRSRTTRSTERPSTGVPARRSP